MATSNDLIRRARLRLFSPSGSGRRMSREELADAVNERLGIRYAIDARYVGEMERGRVRYPSAPRRQAFREVLGASSDGEIGFWHRGSNLDEAFVASEDATSLVIPGPVVSSPTPKVVSSLEPLQTDERVPVLTFTVRPASDGGIEIAVHAADDQSVPIRLVNDSLRRTA